MPYISVRLVGKLSVEQKEAIAREFSKTLLKVAGKPKDKANIVFDEVDDLKGGSCWIGIQNIGQLNRLYTQDVKEHPARV